MPDPAPADRQPARTDAAARGRYLHWLQHSLCAVHATAVWRVAPVPNTERFTSLTVPDVVPLRCDDRSRVYLRATQRFSYGDHPRYPGERKVMTEEYAYTLSKDEELSDELFSWQWHPGAFEEPHVHVADAGHKLHIPTGRVAFEHVLRFAIRELHVRPAVDDATERLNESLRRFVAYRRWS